MSAPSQQRVSDVSVNTLLSNTQTMERHSHADLEPRWQEMDHDGVRLACADFGGAGSPVMLLHEPVDKIRTTSRHEKRRPPS